MRRHLLLVLSLSGCGLTDAPGDPVIVAHRGAAGYWPQNSLAAIQGSVAAGFEVVEFDVGMTSDGFAVISHDPWIEQELCTTADGSALGEDRIFIRDITLQDLQANYLCGGLRDPEQPDAELIAAPMPSLAEVLDVFATDPAVGIHLDFKFEPGMTAPASDMVTAALADLDAAGLDNPFYVSANSAEALLAWHAQRPELETILAWPRFVPDTSNAVTALSWEGVSTLGIRELVDLANQAEAEGLAVAYQVADRRLFEVGQGEGKRMMLWTLNDEKLLRQYSRWPVDNLITDYPESAP